MRLWYLMKCLLLSCVTTFVLALQLFAQASPQLERDIAARALLGEAEKLMEIYLPGEAMPILDQVISHYPESEVAQWARVRQSQCYMDLQQFDQAIATADRIVEDHKGTLLASWAQFIIGESLVRSGKTAKGLAELYKVAEMLPNDNDTTPLQHAYGVIGRVYGQHIKANGGKDVNIIEALGIQNSDTHTKAKVLAIVAASKGCQGRIDLANPVLKQLADECPGMRAELEWAQVEVALGYLKNETGTGDFSQTALESLAQLANSTTISKHNLARIHLALAKHHKKNGDSASLVAVLQSARDRFSDTQSFSEISFELCNSLLVQGRGNDAVAAARQLMERVPTSGYLAPVLYSVGTSDKVSNTDAITLLTVLAEGSYDARWRGLAYRHLGNLYREKDKVKARECYARAVEIFSQSLTEQVADRNSDWREMLQGRINAIETEMLSLDAGEVQQ